MGQIDLDLPDDLRQFLTTAATEAGFASETDYICDLIRKDSRRRAEIRLFEQLNEGRVGPFTRMNDEEFDALEAEALRELERESVRP